MGRSSGNPDQSGASRDWRARWDISRADIEPWLHRRGREILIIDFYLGRLLALVVVGLAAVVGAGTLFGPAAGVVAAGLFLAVCGTPLVFLTNALVGFGLGWVVGQRYVPFLAIELGVPGILGSPLEALAVVLCALSGAALVNRLFVFVVALPVGLAALSLWGSLTTAIGFTVFPTTGPTLGTEPLAFAFWFPVLFLRVVVGLASALLFFLAGLGLGGVALAPVLFVGTAALGANLALDPASLTRVSAELGTGGMGALLDGGGLGPLLVHLFVPRGLSALALVLVGIVCQFVLWPRLVRDETAGATPATT